jgi:hypothetical protein
MCAVHGNRVSLATSIAKAIGALLRCPGQLGLAFQPSQSYKDGSCYEKRAAGPPYMDAHSAIRGVWQSGVERTW